MPIDPISLSAEVAGGVMAEGLRERVRKWTNDRRRWADAANRAWLQIVARSGGSISATSGGFEPRALADWLSSSEVLVALAEPDSDSLILLSAGLQTAWRSNSYERPAVLNLEMAQVAAEFLHGEAAFQLFPSEKREALWRQRTTHRLDSIHQHVSDEPPSGSSPPEPTTAVGETLERLSARTADEVDHVSDAQDGREPIRLRSGLFVEREAGPTIRDFIRATDTPSVGILVGDAGNGKTSLLWDVNRLAMESGRRSWFLPAASLYTQFAGQDGFSAILSAAVSASASGAGAVLLIDTVDLLLRDDASAEEMRLFLDQLSSIDAVRTLVSCRPFEARALPRAYPRFRVAEYSDFEVRQALDSHRRAYVSIETAADASHPETLLAALRSGKAIAPLLRKPLTLRMLFELYAPHQLPVELNLYRLLCSFWEARVCDDVRPGHLPTARSKDLSHASSVLGLVLAAEGSVSIPLAALTFGGLSEIVSRDEIDLLRNRGILAAGSDAIEFFHQVFFEHAAARGLQGLEARTGVPMFLDRLAEFPHDAFLWAIGEQYLLLQISAGSTASERAAQFVTECLASRNGLAFMTAVRVFGQADVPLPAALEFLRVTLAHPNTDPEQSKMVLAATESMLQARLVEVPALLASAWSSGNWTARAGVVAALPRLAEIDPARLQTFVDDGLIEALVTADAGGTVVAPLVAAVLSAGVHRRDWAVEQVRRLTRSAELTSTAARLRVVEVLRSNPDLVPAKEVLQVWIPLLTEGKTARTAEVESAVAGLLADAWSEVNVELRDVVALCNSTNRMLGNSATRAAFRVIASSPDEFSAAAFEFVLREVSIDRLWDAKPELTELARCSPAARESISTMIGPSSSGTALTGHDRLAFDVLAETDLDVFARAIVRLAPFRRPADWTDDRDGLGRYTVPAAIAGLDDAIKALESVAGSDATGPTASSTLYALTHAADRSPLAQRLALDMAQRKGDPAKILALCQSRLEGEGASEAVHGAVRWLLNAAVNGQVSQRRGALRAIQELAGTPSLRAQILPLLEGIHLESDPVCIRHLLGCVRNITLSHEIPLTVWSTLSKLVDGESNDELDRRARYLLVARELLSDSQFGASYRRAWDLVRDARDPLPLLKILLRHISDTPTTGQLSALGEAVVFANARLSGLAARQFTSWLKPSAASVFSNSDVAEVGATTGAMWRGNDHIGVAIAHAAFQAHGTEFLSQAVGALSDEHVPVAVKAAIASWQALLESHFSTTRWPELTDALRGAS